MNNNTHVQTVLFLDENEEQPKEGWLIDEPTTVVVRSKKQLEAYKQQQLKELAALRDKRGNFVISLNEPWKELEKSNTLTISDRSYFMQLIPYAKFDKKPLERNGEILNAHGIADIWNMNYAGACRKITKLVKLGLLEKVKDENDKRISNYFLNPKYMYMGKLRSHDEKFVKVYQNKLNQVIQAAEKIDAKTKKNNPSQLGYKDVIGILNAVMPYFHYQTYYLVKNPDDDILLEGEKVNDALERNPKALKHLSRSMIGRALGYNRVNLKVIDKYMDWLQRCGAVKVDKVNNKPRYIIHPDLMFRKTSDGMDEYTRTIRNQFGQH